MKDYKTQKVQPEDGDEKVDEHDWCDEDIDTKHCHCEPRLSRAAWDTEVVQVDGPVAAAAIDVACSNVHPNYKISITLG